MTGVNMYCLYPMLANTVSRGGQHFSAQISRGRGPTDAEGGGHIKLRVHLYVFSSSVSLASTQESFAPRNLELSA